MLVVIDAPDETGNNKAFEIREREFSNKMVYRADIKLRVRDTYRFLWDKEDRVWGYSGDWGLSYWSKQGDVWKEQPYRASQPGKVRPPDSLTGIQAM